RTLIQEAAQSTPGHAFQTPFLLAEWNEIIDAWQLKDWKEYQNFKRLGRKSRVSPSQREVLWSIFTQVQQKLRDQNLITDAERFTQLAHRFAGMPQTLYEFMVVDEAQDISVSQLRLLATVAGERENALFLCGDQGQQIFQAPFSWKAVGVNIQGRSRNLKINYRTSHQIRFQADRLLDESLSDLDGNTESRRGTISVFNGPAPEVLGCEDEQMEIKRVVGWLQQRIDSGVRPREIGIFIRSEAQLPRALEVVKLLEIPHQVLDAQVDPASGKACISSMHLAKGLEFRVVVVMACDENVVPLNERIQSASEETEIEAIHQSERHLLYVACTRARDQLLISFVTPGSEFLLDLK
ncbi:MAG: 3'-5' exonuclease, partial [bacterium]